MDPIHDYQTVRDNVDVLLALSSWHSHKSFSVQCNTIPLPNIININLLHVKNSGTNYLSQQLFKKLRLPEVNPIRSINIIDLDDVER